MKIYLVWVHRFKIWIFNTMELAVYELSLSMGIIDVCNSMRMLICAALQAGNCTKLNY